MLGRLSLFSFYMETKVYNMEGKEVGTVQLSDAVFGLPWSHALVKQVVEAERAHTRSVIAHAKGRGEVRGGGKKPWRQKGTGRARHGSIRSPIWIGGGVTHGPTKEKIFAKKVNKRMRQKAFFVSLAAKFRDGEMLVLDTFSLEKPKTKEASHVCASLRTIPAFPHLSEKGGRALLALPAHDAVVLRAVRNLPYLETEEVRNMNTTSVLGHTYIIMPKASLEKIHGIS